MCHRACSDAVQPNGHALGQISMSTHQRVAGTCALLAAGAEQHPRVAVVGTAGAGQWELPSAVGSASRGARYGAGARHPGVPRARPAAQRARPAGSHLSHFCVLYLLW